MPSATGAAFAEKSVPLMDRLGQKERDAAKHVAVGAKPGATADGPLDCPHVGMLLPDFAVPKSRSRWDAHHKAPEPFDPRRIASSTAGRSIALGPDRRSAVAVPLVASAP